MIEFSPMQCYGLVGTQPFQKRPRLDDPEIGAATGQILLIGNDCFSKIFTYLGPKSLLNVELVRKVCCASQEPWSTLTEQAWKNARQLKEYNYDILYCQKNELKNLNKWSYYEAIVTEAFLKLVIDDICEESMESARKIKNAFEHTLKLRPESPISCLITYVIAHLSTHDAAGYLSRKKGFSETKDAIYEAMLNNQACSRGENLIHSLFEFFNYVFNATDVPKKSYTDPLHRFVIFLIEEQAPVHMIESLYIMAKKLNLRTNNTHFNIVLDNLSELFNCFNSYSYLSRFIPSTMHLDDLFQKNRNDENCALMAYAAKLLPLTDFQKEGLFDSVLKSDNPIPQHIIESALQNKINLGKQDESDNIRKRGDQELERENEFEIFKKYSNVLVNLS